MPGRQQRSTVASLALIAAIVGAAAGAFAYTAGWLTPHRLTPGRLLTTLVGPNGPALGHRRNHARGLCYTGFFRANGAGSQLSTAEVFARGSYPVVGRLNIGGSSPSLADPMAQVRGFSTRILLPNGQEWRGAAIDAPAFAVSTPQEFHAFLQAAADANAIKSFLATHPATLRFVSWVKSHPRTESWAEDRFNSLDSFVLIDASGARHVVRWSWVPVAAPVFLSPSQLQNQPPDFLERKITEQVSAGPVQWELVLTVAKPGDPTADPSQSWPPDRRTVDVGSLVVDHVEPEADGPCRDINYDPSVLPAGMRTSDDPFPAARSAAYRVSYDHRQAEQSHYPRTPAASAAGGQP